MATKDSIFLRRPLSVFMFWVRKASAKRFWALSLSNMRRALGSASMAACRSAGIFVPLTR